MFAEAMPAIHILTALAAWEVIKHVITRFLRRTVDANYITEDACDKCNKKARDKETALEDRIAELRGIVLVIAMKVGINEADIQRLIK